MLRTIFALAFTLLACVWISSFLNACHRKDQPASAAPIPIHTDTTGLAQRIRFPAPVLEARWAAYPVVAGRSDFGPTDTRLMAVVKIAKGSWPAWKKALGDSSTQGDYRVRMPLADSLFPAELLAQCPPTPEGRQVPGPFYQPKGLDGSSYFASTGVRLGDFLILEFYTR